MCGSILPNREVTLLADTGIITRSSIYLHELALIQVWISNHTHNKVWDEITYPFSNLNGAASGVWEWMSNFIPHFIMDVFTYPYWD